MSDIYDRDEEEERRRTRELEETDIAQPERGTELSWESHMRDLVTNDPRYLEPFGPGDLEASRYNTELRNIIENQQLHDAFERVSPMFSGDIQQAVHHPEQADQRHLEYGARNLDLVADALEGHADRLEFQAQVTTQRREYFYGDMGEIAAQMQFEGLAATENLNDPYKAHDNHPGSDFSVDTPQVGHFEGDSKVSTRDYPFSAYRESLEKDDHRIEAGLMTTDESHLFIPHDQFLAFRDYVTTNYSDKSDEWLSRIHESSMPSEYYTFMADTCTNEYGELEVSRMRELARDCRMGAEYLRRRSGNS